MLHKNRLLFLSRCWPIRLILENILWLFLGEAGSLAAILLRGRITEFFAAVGDLFVTVVRFPSRQRTMQVKIDSREISALLSDRLAGFLIFRRQRREAP